MRLSITETRLSHYQEKTVTRKDSVIVDTKTLKCWAINTAHAQLESVLHMCINFYFCLVKHSIYIWNNLNYLFLGVSVANLTFTALIVSLISDTWVSDGYILMVTPHCLDARQVSRVKLVKPNSHQKKQNFFKIWNYARYLEWFLF